MGMRSQTKGSMTGAGAEGALKDRVVAIRCLEVL